MYKYLLGSLALIATTTSAYASDIALDISKAPWYIQQGYGIIFGFRIALVLFFFALLGYNIWKKRRLFTREHLIIFSIIALLYIFCTMIYNMVVLTLDPTIRFF
jgi:hypothetical protein